MTEFEEISNFKIEVCVQWVSTMIDSLKPGCRLYHILSIIKHIQPINFGTLT